MLCIPYKKTRQGIGDGENNRHLCIDFQLTRQFIHADPCKKDIDHKEKLQNNVIINDQPAGENGFGIIGADKITEYRATQSLVGEP